MAFRPNDLEVSLASPESLAISGLCNSSLECASVLVEPTMCAVSRLRLESELSCCFKGVTCTFSLLRRQYKCAAALKWHQLTIIYND